MKSLRDWIDWAKEKGVAIGHFNISDSEGFNAVEDVASEFGVPVIIGVSEGEREFIGVEEIASLVKKSRDAGLPVFLNADHTYSVEKAREAIEAGFDSVIIDVADKPFEENVSITREIVAYARNSEKEVLVEAELGFIGKSSKVLDNLPDGVSETTQTNHEEAREFVEKTGIDLLAPSVGNIHGMLVRRSLGEGGVKSGNPKLNIERIKAIRASTGVPLVLHGGSGISDEDFLEAIDAGISIIHINTELRVAYKEGIAEGLKSDEIAPYKFMAEGVEGMKDVVRRRLKLFNKMG
jgi:fructose-bisphosphate aldolase class II